MLSGDVEQVLPQTAWVTADDTPFNIRMDTFPDRKGADQQLHARFGQPQSFSPLVSGVGLNADEAFFLKRFEGGRQCGPVHGEQLRHWSHRRRFRSVERHQQ